MTTYLGKSCSFGLPRVPFVNCRQFMYLVISFLVFRAGYGIWLYQFLIIFYLFTLEVLAEQVWKIDERKYGKRNFRSLAVKAEQKRGSVTSHLWKSGQRWNAEVELPIFGSPGRTSLEEERDLSKPFGSKDRAELRKRSFRPLKVLAEQSWCAEAELHIVGSQGRTEVRKRNFTSYEELAEQKCGTDFMSHHW